MTENFPDIESRSNGLSYFVLGVLYFAIALTLFSEYWLNRVDPHWSYWFRGRIEDYVRNGIWIIYIISPYEWLAHRLGRYHASSRLIRTVFCLGALIIAILGAYLFFTSAYPLPITRYDGKRGLFFFLLPAIEWVAILLLELLCFLTSRAGRLISPQREHLLESQKNRRDK